MPLRLRCVLCCLTVTCLAAADASLVRWDGTVLKGQISFDRNVWHFDDGDRRQTIAAHHVYSARFSPQPVTAQQTPARITLIDGGHLTGTVLPSSRLETLPLQRIGGVMDIPIKQVSAIEFAPLDPGVSLGGELPDPPYCIMRNGRTVDAELLWMTYLELGINTRAGRLRLNRDQVHTAVLRPTTPTTPREGAVRLTTIRGDNLTGQLIGLDADWAELLVDRIRLRFPRDRLLRIDRHDERVSSLLDLQPTTLDTVAYLNLVRQPQFDSSLFGGPLLAHGIRYERGIATHSRTTIAYNLGKRYARFLVDVGIDTSDGFYGDAVATVRGDGRELAQVRVHAEGQIISLVCDVGDVAVLELMVDYGTNGSTGDFVTWGDPRLIAP